MKKLKKCAVRLMSLAVAVVTVLAIPTVGLNASAATVNYKWTVDSFEQTGWKGNGSTNFSVDDNVHTDYSWYSIKLDNTDYNISYIERTYNVQPNTKYKFSAMVKYYGYQLDPAAEAETSGACIGKAYSWSNSGYTVSNEWTLMEYEFTTGANETTINLALQNGIYDGHCKGTAWFSDVKLEKAEVTNNWNVLAVFFRNIDATVSLNGETVHSKMSLRESDINDINKFDLDLLPEILKTVSNNKVTINSIDRYYVDEVLTEKDICAYSYKDENKTIPTSYKLDPNNSELVSKVFDKYLAQKHYEQIIVYVPFEELYGGVWAGLGGTKYKGVHFCQLTVSKGWYSDKGERNCVGVVHEICHGLERDSKAINNNKTVDFHEYKNYPNIVDHAWNSIYLRDALPDGKKGVEPSVFYRPNGKYTLVDNDMSTGTGITPGSSSILPPAPKKLTVEAVEDNKVKVSWSAISGAGGYQLVLFRSSDHKDIWATYNYKPQTLLTYLSPITKGKPYYYGIRTAAAIDGKTVYSDWTYLTFTHNGVSSAIIHGDVNNDGKFDIFDILKALDLLLSNSYIDSRTCSAIGISGSSDLTIFVVSDLLTACLSQ